MATTKNQSGEELWALLCNEQAWNERSQLIHLEGFLRDQGLFEAFVQYAVKAAAEENDDGRHAALQDVGYTFNPHPQWPGQWVWRWEGLGTIEWSERSFDTHGDAVEAAWREEVDNAAMANKLTATDWQQLPIDRQAELIRTWRQLSGINQVAQHPVADAVPGIAQQEDGAAQALRHVEEICAKAESSGIHGIGAAAAMRAMAVHWRDHLREGHPTGIIESDLIEAEASIRDARRDLVLRLFPGDNTAAATRAAHPHVHVELADEDLHVIRYSLDNLIDLLSSPTSADRDANANQADRHIEIAKGLLQKLPHPGNGPAKNDLKGSLVRHGKTSVSIEQPHQAA